MYFNAALCGRSMLRAVQKCGRPKSHRLFPAQLFPYAGFNDAEDRAVKRRLVIRPLLESIVPGFD